MDRKELLEGLREIYHSETTVGKSLEAVMEILGEAFGWKDAGLLCFATLIFQRYVNPNVTLGFLLEMAKLARDPTEDPLDRLIANVQPINPDEYEHPNENTAFNR